METTNWTTDSNEAHPVIRNRKSLDIEDLITSGTIISHTAPSSGVLMSMMEEEHGYGGNYYCQNDMDHIFNNPFNNESSLVPFTGKAPTYPPAKFSVKREPKMMMSPAADAFDTMRKQVSFPILSNVKMEYSFDSSACCGDASTTKPRDFSLDTSLSASSLSPTSDLGSSCSGSPAIDHQLLMDPSSAFSAAGGNEVGFEVYHDLIMRHLIQDIHATSKRLCISSDPKLWTCSDSVAWLMDVAAQYKLAQVPIDKLAADGATLSLMNLNQFVQCFPNGGETVHAQLQIWNSANDYCTRQNNGHVLANVDDASIMSLSAAAADEQQLFAAPPPPMNHNHHQRSVIQRSGPSSTDTNFPFHQNYHYALSLPLSSNQHQLHHHSSSSSSADSILSTVVGNGGIGGAAASSLYGFGAMLPSPGPCDDRGVPAEADYCDTTTFCDEEEPNGSPSSEARDIGSGGGTGNASNIHLWQFLRELLEQYEKYGQCVRWIDHSRGIFKIEDSHGLARLWGKRKNRPAMNYDKLSRSLRQYYKKNILKKTTRSQRLVYQFLHPYHVC